jgi:pimeloyl-ACP methyl ester carboxylesterase
MATFVLVHGAWHGGWCWKKVAPLLRAAGHEVYMPTLTGVGERAHLLTPDIGLDTHVTDILNVLEYEDLRDVILVGHSYGGMVIAGVAERVPERVRHLVYLDALFPMDDDRSMAALARRLRPELWATFEAQIRASGDRVCLPAPSGETLFGVTNEEDLRWLRERLMPHPAKTWLESGAGDDETDRHLPRAYIICPDSAGERTWFAAFGERIEREGGKYHELAGGHDVMVTMPKELSALLASLAVA